MTLTAVLVTRAGQARSDHGTLYTGDTDTPRRCGFLWEVKVKW